MTGVVPDSHSTQGSLGPLRYTRRGLAMLFFWLLWGDFCFMLMESVVPTLVPLKFQQLGASNATVGLVLTTLPMGMTLILNPIISFKSDRYRSRFGRRIPFLMLTLPPLVICLCMIGFADRFGLWVHRHLVSWPVASLSSSACAIAAVAIAVTVFSFFNTVVNAVFWYLFNDVVPESMLARLMSWFRAVSTVAVTVYNLFIFKYAGEHMAAMFVGAGLIYLVGFGLMCLFVKEGNYPPPPKNVDQGTGIISSIKTYGKECHSHGLYRNVFMIGVGFGILYASNVFTLYHLQATGLDLDGIGKIRGATGVATFVVVLISGWLADRFHPLRIAVAGLLLQTCIATPVTLLWLFYNPTPHQSYLIWLVISICLTAPAGALIGMFDPPTLMRIFPRDRYGQFCSASALWRAFSSTVGGFVLGICLDLLTKHVGSQTAYRCLPIWQLFSYVVMLVFCIRLYRSWKTLGGDEHYIPPPPCSVADNSLAREPQTLFLAIEAAK